ncbi:dihydropteroate synthase [Vibrio cholerae NCTC 8457]|nr:dihydropteroate synthase [Vibrio cholerae NCTC 8457]
MIFKTLNKQPAECVAGSVACATLAAQKGAQIIRVHDVEQTIDALKMVQMMHNNL